MVEEREFKKFQKHIVASFTNLQIQNIEAWRSNNVIPTEGWSYLQTFNRALRVAEVDEKGKPMSEQSRKRIKYGMLVISEMHKTKQDLDPAKGEVKVWQVGPGEDNLEIRLNRKPSRDSRLHRRY